MKKYILMLVTVFLSLSIISCMSHIEDSNGDDTTLETIDLESSIKDGSYSSISSLTSSSYSGGTTYSFSYSDIDYDYVSLSYGKISGTTKIHCSDMGQGEELVLTITNQVSEGNFEIIVIGPNKTIVEEVNVNTTTTVTIPSTDEGEYFVVIGAESAVVTIDIEREIN
jgi:hypothetical protein